VVRTDLRTRLGALALATGLFAGAVIAMLKGAWWVSLACVLVWAALELGLSMRRPRRRGGRR
jgi:hypothetical protein